MSLAAVIVHYGEPRFTERLIDVLRSSAGIDRTIVVLHDDYPLPRSEDVDWIESVNRGYAAGFNTAVRYTLQTYNDVHSMLAINADIRVDSKTLEQLHSEHQKSNAHCTFPVLLENNRLLHGYQFSRFGTLKQAVNPDWYSGACFILAVDAWQKIGGFDESYFHYFEDRDFCLRLRAEELRIHQAATVIIEHEGKSGADYPGSDLPKFAVRNHLIALERSSLLDPLTFLNVIFRHFLYLFQWRSGWRGIPKWVKGIKEFLTEESKGSKD